RHEPQAPSQGAIDQLGAARVLHRASQRVVSEDGGGKLIGAGVESPLRARPVRVRVLNAGHLAVTIILLPAAPYHHSETSGRRAKVFKLSVWARMGPAFASRASASLAKRSGVRQLAAAFSGELARRLIGQGTAQRCRPASCPEQKRQQAAALQNPATNCYTGCLPVKRGSSRCARPQSPVRQLTDLRW